MDDQKPLDEKPPEEYYPPPPMDPQDPEVLKKKKRRRIIIILVIVFGSLIGLGLLAIGIIYIIGYSLTEMCNNACSSCNCDCGCDEQCSESCSKSCNDSCQNSCDSSSCCSGDNITASADVGDSSLDVQTYAKYVWETLRDWFFDLFN